MLLDRQVRLETRYRGSWHLGAWAPIGFLTLSLFFLLIPWPSATILAAQQAISGFSELRYGFQKGETYVYKVTITADFGEMKETREGLSIYAVKSTTNERIELTHSGSLSARRTRRDGGSVMSFPSIHSPFFWTGGVSAREGEVAIDARGEPDELQYVTPLPYMLGHFQLLAIEPLPETSQATFEKKQRVTVTQKEASRFPPMGFGPFGRREREGMNRSASETISYALAGSDGQVARIKRTYDLKTDDKVEGKPRLRLTGKGERSFDLQQGVAKSELMRYTVEVNEEGQSATIPVTVDYRLLEDQEEAEALEEVAKKKAALPRSHTVGSISVPTRNSPLGGGPGGIAFSYLDPEARPVVGVRYQMGSWGGEQTLGHIEPLYTREAAGPPWQTILAREGYALGALQVDGTKYVNAVRLAFMRVEGESLDTNDRYVTEWIGTTTGGTPKSFFSDGARVLGIHGKRAAVLDAVGLVFEAK